MLQQMCDCAQFYVRELYSSHGDQYDEEGKFHTTEEVSDMSFTFSPFPSTPSPLSIPLPLLQLSLPPSTPSPPYPPPSSLSSCLPSTPLPLSLSFHTPLSSKLSLHVSFFPLASSPLLFFLPSSFLTPLLLPCSSSPLILLALYLLSSNSPCLVHPLPPLPSSLAPCLSVLLPFHS